MLLNFMAMKVTHGLNIRNANIAKMNTPVLEQKLRPTQ
jgi:hypothetical protein